MSNRHVAHKSKTSQAVRRLFDVLIFSPLGGGFSLDRKRMHLRHTRAELTCHCRAAVELDQLRAQCRSIFEAEKQVTQAIFRIAWRRDRRLSSG
jgi:hypothetical protein